MLSDKKLSEILLSQNYLTAKDLARVQKLAKEYSASVEETLVTEGVITKDLLGQAMAEFFGVAYLDLGKEKVDRTILSLIPETMARERQLAAINQRDGVIKLALADPSDKQLISLIKKKLGQTLQVYFILSQDLTEAWSFYRSTLVEEFKALGRRLADVQLSREAREQATVDIVDAMLRHGHDSKASDIHIEPYAKKVAVRFRIDGVMHDVLTLDKKLFEPIVARLKIMAKMRTDEHRAAQDGKLRYQVAGEAVDVRVSIVPIIEGENVVLRLLAASTKRLGLTNLGLIARDLKKVKRAIGHPHGMILVTGPTGSGKTTTLYAILALLNNSEVHIATIEDPVEYNIEGVSQIQVDPKTNLTFASGLRAIVRQDPDIIMVGEIRDEETAGIAVNSALTGHLVLSTLHTNDAVTTLPRLIDMKVEPFLVASTVNLIMAQRLVRRNCERCRVSYKLTSEEKLLIDNEPAIQKILRAKKITNLSRANFYRGQGCPVCGQTGFNGRVGIFEVVELNDELRQLVTDKTASNELLKAAERAGMTTMLADGIDKIFSGLTTWEEVLRVTRG